MRAKEKTIIIKDIDGITTKEEVKKVVMEELGIGLDECRVSNLRPYFDGNQAVTVGMASDSAMKLLSKGKIRIGLSLCGITE